MEQESPVFSRPPLTLEDRHLKKFSVLPDEMRRFILALLELGDLPRAYAETGLAPVQYSGDQSLADALDSVGMTPREVALALKRCLNGKVTRFDRHQEPFEVTDKALIVKVVELYAKISGNMINIHKRDNSDKKGVVDLFPDDDAG